MKKLKDGRIEFSPKEILPKSELDFSVKKFGIKRNGYKIFFYKKIFSGDWVDCIDVPIALVKYANDILECKNDQTQN